MWSDSDLLSLPSEIRLIIWHFVVENICVQILEDGSTRCNEAGAKTDSDLHDWHRNPSSRTSHCTNWRFRRLVGFSLTCRKIYRETNSRIYRDLLVSFASTKVFWTFIGSRLATDHLTTFSLKWLFKVHIEIGPAKHADMATNYNTRGALRTLARDATNLKVLGLTMDYYLQAQTDAVLLNTKTLKVMLQFRNLDEITLQMHERPPGPLGIYDEALSPKILDQKLGCLEAVLRSYLCSRRDVGHFPEGMAPTNLPIREVDLSAVKKEIRQRVHAIR